MLKSDGNGGYNIQKGTFTLIMLIIALLSCVATVVAYGVTIKSDVDFLKEAFEEAGPRHIETIKEIETSIKNNQISIIQNHERIISMHDDIKDIKEILK